VCECVCVAVEMPSVGSAVYRYGRSPWGGDCARRAYGVAGAVWRRDGVVVVVVVVVVGEWSRSQWQYGGECDPVQEHLPFLSPRELLLTWGVTAVLPSIHFLHRLATLVRRS